MEREQKKKGKKEKKRGKKEKKGEKSCIYSFRKSEAAPNASDGAVSSEARDVRSREMLHLAKKNIASPPKILARASPGSSLSLD